MAASKPAISSMQLPEKPQKSTVCIKSLLLTAVFKMIRTHDYEGLRGLLTPREYDDLMRRVETEWTDQVITEYIWE